MGRLLEEHQVGHAVSLAKLIYTGQVFGFEWRGKPWIPLFQFDAKDLALKVGAQRVRSALPSLWSAWRLATWFAAPHARLNGCSPVDMLDSDFDAVLSAAQAVQAHELFALARAPYGATDGQIGHVKDLYFDDDAWVIRYIVVDAGSWLSSRMVLLSPISIHGANWSDKDLSVGITKEQVKNSPNIDTDKPVTRQIEAQYLGYYGYAPYWGGAGMWGGGLYPYNMSPGYTGMRVERTQRERDEEVALNAERFSHRNDDPHLRSCESVTGYHLRALDGEIGHVTGYLIDDETWAIRYLIVDTSNWWLGHKVLVAPEWIKSVHWSSETVSVDLTLELVRAAPAYDPQITWRRESDHVLYQHYGRTGYWAGSATSLATDR